MITFKQYLAEAAKNKKLPSNVSKPWKAETLEIDKMIELINKHCRESLRAINRENALLFRGFGKRPGGGVNPVLLDSTNALRASRDSNNIYQLMMDRSKHFEGIPSRSNSFICSTHRSSADTHGAGDPYVMLPFDGTTVAYVKNSDDMFNSAVGTVAFSSRISGKSVEDFSNSIREILTALGIKPDSGSRYIDAAKINSALSKIPNEIIAVVLELYDNDAEIQGTNGLIVYDSYDRYGSVRVVFERNTAIRMDDSTKKVLSRAILNPVKPENQKILLSALKKHETTSSFTKKLKRLNSYNKSAMFDDMATAVMTPQKLGVKTTIAGKSIGDDVECWFSGKCIAIPNRTFDKMLVKMAQNKTTGKLSQSIRSAFDLKYL